MGGFHLLDLIVILVIGLLIAGPKALQSISRNAGKGVGQAKAMKDKVMDELPMEEVSKISETISKIPLSPQQAVQMLVTPDKEKKQVETKEESSSPSSKEKGDGGRS
jgi:Sec-independent protein translocase protein TatA